MDINIEKIREHYEHARTKHPYFCDRLVMNIDFAPSLENARAYLQQNIERGLVEFEDVLDCELREIQVAISQGDEAHAVEECYDAIAVLLRVIDVLEGRQALGNPTK